MKENQVERKLSRKEILILIGLTGFMPVLSACDQLLNTPTSQGFSEVTQIPASIDTPYTKTITPTSTATQEAKSTPTETPTETQTPTPTPTETLAPAENRWQLSPDGHVYYNEAELYDGLFTINTEHPENVEKYWEDTVRGLWNLNFVGENTAFLSQFPTADSLIDYLQKGGGPVSNLWIPVIYPNAARQNWYQGTFAPTDWPVDLSRIAIAIYKPTRDEIYHFSPSYATGTKFISFLGAAGEAQVEQVTLDDTNIFKITLRRDLFMDATRSLIIDLSTEINQDFTMLAMTDEKTDTENLLAATQLLRSWPLHMQIRDKDYAYALVPGYNPSKINFNTIWPTFQEYDGITSLDGTPLAIR